MVISSVQPGLGEPVSVETADRARLRLTDRVVRFVDFRSPYLIPLVVLCITRGFFWRLLPFAAEDAYITYRYARHLVLGYGLVYNPGERVMGFSSPVWTLWNALGYAVLRDPVLWSRLWSLAADVATLIGLTWLIARYASRTSAWCFALFFAAWPYFSAVAMSGMESSAMLALVVLTAVLAEHRHSLTGPALAAVALMRPEGVVAAAVLSIRARARDRLAAAAIFLLGLGILAWYFGTVIPQSVRAKAAIYGTPGLWSGRQWWDWAFPAPLGQWPVTSEGSALFAIAVVLAPAAVLGAMSLWRQRRTGLAVAVGSLVAVWAGYAVLGVAYFYWYLALPLAAYAALVAIGLPRITQGGRALYVSLALFVLGTWSIVPGLYQSRASAEFLGFGATAEYLVANSRAGERVFLEPIGMVGYRCKLVVIDEVGLVSPWVVKRRVQGDGWMADVIAQAQPQWLVLRRSMVDNPAGFAGTGKPFRSSVDRDSTLAHYQLATEIFREAGENRLTVWRRTR